jgi:hypothetical protein
MAFKNTGTTRLPPVVSLILPCLLRPYPKGGSASSPSSSPTPLLFFQVIEEAPHADTPLEEYDHNCVFPIREFRTDKVIVTPLIVIPSPFSFPPEPRLARSFFLTSFGLEADRPSRHLLRSPPSTPETTLKVSNQTRRTSCALRAFLGRIRLGTVSEADRYRICSSLSAAGSLGVRSRSTTRCSASSKPLAKTLRWSTSRL